MYAVVIVLHGPGRLITVKWMSEFVISIVLRYFHSHDLSPRTYTEWQLQ